MEPKEREHEMRNKVEARANHNETLISTKKQTRY